jgi:hypothetical protein
MVSYLLDWLDAGPEEALEVLAVLTGETEQLDPWREDEPEPAGVPVEPHRSPEKRPVEVEGTPTPSLPVEAVGVPYAPTHTLETVRAYCELLGWPAVSWEERTWEGFPHLTIPARSLAGEAEWERFFAEEAGKTEVGLQAGVFIAQLELVKSDPARERLPDAVAETR